jgi:exodeoxyribonuclease VII small subunit
MTEKPSDIPFETAFARLEEILEKMNSGDTTLDESLKLFEEADRLIQSCGKRLNEAERRVEMLIKNRSGELVLDPEGKPTSSEFQRMS